MSAKTVDAKKYITTRIVPELVDLPPEKWVGRFKEIAGELPEDHRGEVIREGVKIARTRGQLVSAVGDAVDEVRGLVTPDGRPVGGFFKGVVLFGRITGRSYGELDPEAAIEPTKDRLADIDMFTVLAYPTRKILTEYDIDGHPVSYMTCKDPLFGDSGTYTALLEDLVTEKAGIQAAVHVPICVRRDDPNVTVRDLTKITDKYTHFRPTETHFIGDEETRELFSDRLRRFHEKTGR